MTKSTWDRFWDKVDVTESCWIWTGARRTKKGQEPAYGNFFLGRDTQGQRKYGRAHKWLYEFYNGPVPVGMVVRHGCHQPSCVNPDHMSIGTQKENMTDSVFAGRLAYGEYASKSRAGLTK